MFHMELNLALFFLCKINDGRPKCLYSTWIQIWPNSLTQNVLQYSTWPNFFKLKHWCWPKLKLDPMIHFCLNQLYLTQFVEFSTETQIATKGCSAYSTEHLQTSCDITVSFDLSAQKSYCDITLCQKEALSE